MAEYCYACKGVTVNLVDNSKYAGADALVDTLIFIEDVAGGEFNDHITGDSNSNFLYGREGHDTLGGGVGKQWLKGSAADDTLVLCDSDAGIGGMGAYTLVFRKGGYQIFGIFNASEGDKLDIPNLGISKEAFLATATDVLGLHTWTP